jgi:hypothetical protein
MDARRAGNRRLGAALVVCLALEGCRAAETPVAVVTGGRAARVGQAYSNDCRRFAGSADILVRPGLVADRTSRWVRVWAETANPSYPVEFPLVAPGSGHDYEALAVAFARASDVHEALCFIGMQPGRPVDSARMRFWPKGERVRVTFEWPEAAGGRSLPAEELVLDTRTGRPLPPVGFVFVGSSRVPSPAAPERPGEPTNWVYAADAHDPNAIISVYNEPTTVLDVPRQAAQGEVYSFLVRNPGQPLGTGDLIQVVMRPEYPAGRRRVRDLSLTVTPGTNGSGFRLLLEDAEPEGLRAGPPVKDVLAALGRMTEEGQDPYVTLRLGGDLSLAACREACRFVGSIEGERGIRVEPPPPETLYYRAFLPPEAFRNRAERPLQPWELYLKRAGDGLAAELRDVTENWEEAGTNSVFRETRLPVDGPAALPALLGRKPRPPVVIVFADPDIRYRDLLAYVNRAVPTHPIIYAFLPPESGGAQSGSESAP